MRWLTVGWLTACLIPGGTDAALADNFLLRNFTWFGTLDGKDLREGCVPGASDRLRFIYNGIYQEQVRRYELERPFPGAAATLDARVLTKPDFSNFRISELFLGSRDHASRAVLDDGAFGQLVDALMADGFAAPVPSGLTLPSDGFYWVVSGCVGGRFDINGWLHPTERFRALRFPALLFARDATGVAVNPPRAIDAGERMRARTGNQDALDIKPAFDVRLDDGGVVGRVPGF